MPPFAALANVIRKSGFGGGCGRENGVAVVGNFHVRAVGVERHFQIED
jgi:hypothetical protein